MKKLTLILASFIAFTFASCSKAKTCTCTSTSTVNGIPATVSDIDVTNMDKTSSEDANVICPKSTITTQTKAGAGAYTNVKTRTCVIS